MARHIMAVCVVCLLCAHRVPCLQHFEEGGNTLITDGVEYQQLNAKVFQRATDLPTSPSSIAISSTDSTQQQQQQQPSSSSNPNLSTNGRQHAQHRRKRHAGHAHAATDGGGEEEAAWQHRPEITADFLQRIFDEYGHSDGTINVREFQSMLKQLGLHQLIGQKLAAFPSATNELNDNESCIADARLVHHVQPHDLSHHDEHHEHHEHNHNHNHGELQHSGAVNCSTHGTNDTNSKSAPCSAAVAAQTRAMVEQDEPEHAHSEYGSNYTLSQLDMLHLCPVLLYQLASPLAAKRAGCIDGAILADIDNFEATKFEASKEDIMYVWIYAFISVFSCGILGLVGVAIIPFMDSRYYKHIIQFLVSLAVGTMTSDALLHLFPHAIAGQNESNMIYKGLTCMGGIIFSYFCEHGLTMISEWRKRIAKAETNKKPSRAKVVRDPDSSINNSSTGGDKLCKSKYSSYPYCYDEIAMDTKNDVWLHLPNNTAADEGGGGGAERKRNGRADVADAVAGACAEGPMAAQSLLSTSHNHYGELNNHQHSHNHHQQLPPDSNTISTDIDGNSVEAPASAVVAGAGGDGVGVGAAVLNGKDKSTSPTAASPASNNDTVTVILREHESSHHGHSHKHGHVHSPPESLSAVAWMIIMGDGLHNFTDGMAIGAAFAENIAGGFSTSLAVFCHELPHELGDFAILIKAGMSVKSAVFYNLLTGVLSFIGMIFGIVFGQSQDTAQWMFAFAAGLFIYIALVDMMPELSATHQSIKQFALQILGMSGGVLIMLTIAIYEGDLMNVFSASGVGAAPAQHVH